VQHVLTGRTYSKQNRFFQEIAANLGQGLLTSEGGLWQRQRRLIQPLFTRRQVASYMDIMAEEAVAAADRWTPPEVDAHAEMVRLALRVVGRAIFGDDIERATEVLRWAFPVVNAHTFRRATSPLPLPASWPLPRNRAAAEARQALYAIVDELIEHRRRNGADGDGDDLLSRLLAARDADTGEAMDVQQVRDEALIFLLAGHETTSTALTFTLHLLGRHPEEQARVQEELDTVLAGRPPATGDLPRLEYTTMLLKEAMRLYPPAYATGRRAEVEDEIGGYRIPVGADVVVSQWATHRHPLFWDAPHAFDPERFTPEREAERHPYAYFPFGRGPRACIGSNFAMFESLAAVAVLAQRFEIRRDPGPVPLDTFGITLRPAGAVPIRLAPR
jgi:cytochrome P450